MPVSLAGLYQTCTDAAICVEIDGDDVWIPRSVIEDGPDTDTLKRGDHVDVEVRSWWADKEGL